jgi:hypothetical protein
MTHTTGSLSSYFKHGCRCDSCKSLAAQWRVDRLKNATPERLEELRVRKNELARIRRSKQVTA